MLQKADAVITELHHVYFSCLQTADLSEARTCRAQKMSAVGSNSPFYKHDDSVSMLSQERR